MLTISQWVLVVGAMMVGLTTPAKAADVAPILIDGVRFHAQQAPAKGSLVILSVIDPTDPARSWSISVFEPDSSTDIFGVRKDFRVTAIQTISGGLIVETDTTAAFFVDVKSRQAEPILDRRSEREAMCEAHKRRMVEALVPIHYGLATGRPLTREQRERFPLADRAFEAGCCVRAEKIALVMVCPEDQRTTDWP